MDDQWQGRVDQALERIVQRSKRLVVGCSEQEPHEFQVAHGIALPAAYLRFLRGAGKDPGEFLIGSDLAFGGLDALQSAAQGLLDDDGGPKPPDGAFVFCSHQGYQFLFFLLDGRADPEVQHYLEGERAIRIVAPSFSEWLIQTVIEEFPA